MSYRFSLSVPAVPCSASFRPVIFTHVGRQPDQSGCVVHETEHRIPSQPISL
jgi:hypothetical protein